MLQIEFRGKQIDSGEWVEGTIEFHLVDGNLDKTKKNAYITYDSMDSVGKVYRHRFEVIPETVGQYTGFNDKNKKKIFGGDIIRRRWFRKDKPQYVEEMIYFNIGAFWCIKNGGVGGELLGSHLTKVIPAQIEVIGNIYDNPELLITQ